MHSHPHSQIIFACTRSTFGAPLDKGIIHPLHSRRLLKLRKLWQSQTMFHNPSWMNTWRTWLPLPTKHWLLLFQPSNSFCCVYKLKKPPIFACFGGSIFFQSTKKLRTCDRLAEQIRMDIISQHKLNDQMICEAAQFFLRAF